MSWNRQRIRKGTALAATLLGTASLAACAASGVLQPTLEESLFGSWEWLSAEGGIAGTVRTPASEGFTRQLILTRPDRVVLLTDSTVEAETTFELLPAVDLGDEFLQARLRYADPIFGFEEQEVGFDIEGRLMLIDPCCDGFTYSWARIEGE